MPKSRYVDWEAIMKLFNEQNERIDKKFDTVVEKLDSMIANQASMDTLLKKHCDEIVTLAQSEKDLGDRVGLLEKGWAKISAVGAVIGTFAGLLISVLLKLLKW